MTDFLYTSQWASVCFCESIGCSLVEFYHKLAYASFGIFTASTQGLLVAELSKADLVLVSSLCFSLYYLDVMEQVLGPADMSFLHKAQHVSPTILAKFYDEVTGLVPVTGQGNLEEFHYEFLLP